MKKQKNKGQKRETDLSNDRRKLRLKPVKKIKYKKQLFSRDEEE